MAQVMRLIYR